jgi:hypothetical protein
MRKTKIRKLRPRNEVVRMMTAEEMARFGTQPDTSRGAKYQPPLTRKGVIK